jgi:DNA-binding CsgD family transcriptional regulator
LLFQNNFDEISLVTNISAEITEIYLTNINKILHVSDKFAAVEIAIEQDLVDICLSEDLANNSPYV